jgi:hypothetical protein
MVLRGLGFCPEPSPSSYVDAKRLSPDSLESPWTRCHHGLDLLVEYHSTPIEVVVGRLSDLDPALSEALRRYTTTVWARAFTSQTNADTGPQLSPEDLLLQVAAHSAAKHLHFRLIWLRDLAGIVTKHPALDWDYVAETAASLRIGVPVAAALDAVVRWLGARIPLDRRDRIRRGHPVSTGRFVEWESRRLHAYVASLDGRDLTQSGPAMRPLCAVLARLSGWRPRVHAVRWMLLPSDAYLAERTRDGERASYAIAWTSRTARRLGLIARRATR